MPPKRPRVADHDDDADDSALLPTQPMPKRRRLSASTPATVHPNRQSPRNPRDLLTPLSDELLLRILSSLSPVQLLHTAARVSRRLHRLAHDSQLWKALYYARFVLPRALRIPGFRRDGRDGHRKLHYKGRRALWADGRLGGLVRDEEGGHGAYHPAKRGLRVAREGEGKEEEDDDRVDWLRQFKIRHNWARGKCAVEELKLGPDLEDSRRQTSDDGGDERSGMLVKVVEGLAVTADAAFGLRAWDLKTRKVVAHIALRDDQGPREHDDAPAPSCMAVDDRELDKGALHIAVGFADGSFGVWKLGADKRLMRRYRHEKSSNGELVGMAYAHPYLLTATGAVLVSLYTFDVPEKAEGADEEADECESEDEYLSTATEAVTTVQPASAALPAPYLMTSLKSHTSDPPLALSLRKMGPITVASIAYTFFTRHGWSIGIQDLHITARTTSPRRAPAITTTQLAYTTPVQTSGPARPPPHAPPAQASSSSSPPPNAAAAAARHGPTTLSYTHPYLLATLPDNTLLLHLCTATRTALALAPAGGIRLWGHTSGISDAAITARGKAVSVSARGAEMRVWELEGGGSGTVEIRAKEDGDGGAGAGAGGLREEEDWGEARRNWVGFDDEMVIVLKEARGGRESLLVYDFT